MVGRELEGQHHQLGEEASTPCTVDCDGVLATIETWMGGVIVTIVI